MEFWSGLRAGFSRSKSNPESKSWVIILSLDSANAPKIILFSDSLLKVPFVCFLISCIKSFTRFSGDICFLIISSFLGIYASACLF